MAQGYGLPLVCPQSGARFLVRGLVRGQWFVVATRTEFGMLKIPDEKTMPCPHCSRRLIAIRHRQAEDD